MTPWRNDNWHVADLGDVAATRHFKNVPDGDGLVVYFKAGGHITLWNHDAYDFDAAYESFVSDSPLPY